MNRFLQIVMAIGAVAFVGIIVSVVVAATSSHSSAQPVSHAGSGVTNNPPSPPAPPPLLPTMRPPTQSYVVGCASAGRSCDLALLDLINRDRVARNLPKLVFDELQAQGVPSSRGHACAGTVGHSKAMAATGHVWHKNRRYPNASYPRDICEPVAAHAENVAAASGTEWQALQRIERKMISGKSGKGAYKHLTSRKFSRVGIAIGARGHKFFVTEDFL